MEGGKIWSNEVAYLKEVGLE
uniref:Uncharacterized protein n=1 Tax=Rhizophora mucronata TaxID=61149 RepID=A0A2P2JRF9_RHIMU